MSERSYWTTRIVGTIAAFVLVLGQAVAARAQLIDRVLAVVNTQIITLSDVRVALRLGLVRVAPGGDETGAALQQLVDRRLLAAEVERYAQPEPAAAAINAALQAIRAPFRDALAFEIEINRYGLSQEALRRFVRDTLRIEAYLAQRLASIRRASDEDLQRYYREHAGALSRDGALRPLTEIRDEVRALLLASEREAFIAELLAGLRRRADIQIMYAPEPPRP